MSDTEWERGDEDYGSEDAQQGLGVAVAHCDSGALAASEKLTGRNKESNEAGACAGGTCEFLNNRVYIRGTEAATNE